jgi:hypothetical protein
VVNTNASLGNRFSGFGHSARKTAEAVTRNEVPGDGTSLKRGVNESMVTALTRPTLNTYLNRRGDLEIAFLGSADRRLCVYSLIVS